MIKVRILSDKTNHLKGIGKTSGKPYDMHLQTAYAFTVDADGQLAEIPEKFEFVLDQGQPPFQRGDYTLTPDAVFIDRNGRMGINPRLKPAAPSGKGA